jgi:hypothetical protein
MEGGAAAGGLTIREEYRKAWLDLLVVATL